MKHPWTPLVLLMALLLSFGSVSFASAELGPRVEWITEEAPATAMSLEVPADAFVRHGGLMPRHRGFDIVQISSFELGDHHHVGLGVPAGEWIVHFAYDGNSFDPAGDLEDFVKSKIASPYYLPTGKRPQVGDRSFVELEGELGTLWITHEGWNVYSFLIYGGLEQMSPRLIERLIKGWSLEQTDPIYIAPEDRGNWSSGMELKVDTAVPSSATAPSMKMPWSKWNKYTYSGGPHHPWYTGNGCSNIYYHRDMSGVDFALPNNTDVLAAAGGTVTYSGNAGDGRGNFVRIKHSGGVDSEYWHLTSTSVSSGSVSQGKLIGKSGANHLHFELRKTSDNSRFSTHGVSIDGYTIYALQSSFSDNLAYNYQGTLIRGSGYQAYVWHCDQWVKRWQGTSQTIVAGSSTLVTSTNTKIP